MTEFISRIATAPISWGICEVPGWGLQLPVDRVLSEMSSLGFSVTELGSDGYLPSEPAELRKLLADYDMSLLSAFVPLVVHDAAEPRETLHRVKDTASKLAEMGATYFASAPVTSWDWQPRQQLTVGQWQHALDVLTEIDRIVADQGLTQVIHSHVDTIVETDDEVQRILDGTEVKFVLDTAHLAVGGFNPVDFATRYADRVGLVHIKDVDTSIATRLNNKELTLMEAVQQDIFPPVGNGDLDIEQVVVRLEDADYNGWYVIEQDVAITGAEPLPGEGPIVGVRESLEYLKGVNRRLEGM